MLKDYEIYAKDWAEILKQSKIDLAQYEKEIWKIAAEYPDFQPQAQEIQNKLLLLKAAEKDAWTARQELKYLENPELRPKIETETEVKTMSRKELAEKLLAEGQGFLTTDPHLTLFPALVISALMLAFNLFGNGLRDAFDPRMRGL